MSYPTDGASLGKPRLTLRDWLFGAGGKRRLLEVLLTTTPQRWTQTELARAAGLHVKGSVDVHIVALLQLGILDESGDRYFIDRGSPLVPPLRTLVEALAAIDDAKLKRPPLVGDSRPRDPT